MKTIIISASILFLIIIGVTANYSCNKSNLDLLPHGPTEESYFTQESDFTKAVLGVYAKMDDLFWYNGCQTCSTMPIFILPGDDITTSADDEFEIFGPIQPSSGRVDYFYKTWYQIIERANVVIQKVNEVQDGVYQTPNLKNYHKGEALFLRGYAFFNLWNYFGTSPLDTARVTSSDQFTPPGTTGTQLLDQAISDFTEAANLLPASWDAANRGRVTQNSAYGMLGKALVFRASATSGNAADYTSAVAAFNKISGVTLVPNFADNFAADAENNSESLFEYQASQAFGGDNVWLPNDFDNAIGNLSVFWGYYDNNFALFGYPTFIATTKLLNAFNPADPRRDETLDPANRSIKKYVSRDKLDQPGVGSVNNPRLLRYADVLLLKAEAIIQSGGSAADAINLINEVRTRARNISGGPEPANYSTAVTDKTTIMNWIINERFLELAGEGQRWIDLRRWQMQGIINLDNAFFSSNTSSMSFQLPKHLLLPIPNSETDVNPNVTQNAGY